MLLHWDVFVFLIIILFCISKPLTSKEGTRLDQWKLRRMEGVINTLSPSFSLFYMYFEVLRWVISEGGQLQSLTDERFFKISFAHHKSVFVHISWRRESSPGGSRGESMTQWGCDYCQPPENGVREHGAKRWGRGSKSSLFEGTRNPFVMQ